jgi:hypothetical protein
MINAPSHNAMLPAVAINDAGDAIVLWSEAMGDGSNMNDPYQIAANRWNGTSWSTPENVNDIPGTSPDWIDYFVAAAINSNGDAIAVWSQGPATRASTFSNGTWSASQDISKGMSTGAGRFPEIVYYAPGKAMATWLQHNGTDRYDVATNTFTSGGGWGTPEIISDKRYSVSVDAYNAAPHLAVDANGTAAVVWIEGFYDLALATPLMVEALYTPGAGWGASASIASLPDGSRVMYYPVTAIGANRSGKIYSVWGLDSM